jgi:hypothetical protein
MPEAQQDPRTAATIDLIRDGKVAEMLAYVKG